MCLKKVPTFELSVTLSNLNRFSKFLHCWKAYEVCYKTRTTIPTSPYVCYYSPLGNKKVIFGRYSADMEENATNVDIFGVCNVEASSIPTANKKFSCHCPFTNLLLWSICGIGNSSQQMSLQLSTNNNYNMVFSDEDKILIKSLYLKRYTPKRLTDEFPEKSWTKHGVNKLLKKLLNTGTVLSLIHIWRCRRRG